MNKQLKDAGNRTLRLLIAETRFFSPEALRILDGFAQVEKRDISKAQLPQALMDCDVFWFRLGFRIDAADIPPAPCCRYIVCPATGLDHIDRTACEAKGIKVLGLLGERDFLKTVRATAELTIGLTLALMRKIPQAVRHVREGGWDRDRFQGQELLGKTIGIVGVGRLGSITAQYFQVFGCRILGYDPIPFQQAKIAPSSSLEELVAEADIVSLHVDYHAANHHMISRRVLSHFKKGSILVNTSRGAVVDSTALIEGLQSGRLAGAALDVIEREDAFESSPLIAYAREHDHLLITPHIGGNTAESFAKTEVFMAHKLRETVLGPANKDGR